MTPTLRRLLPWCLLAAVCATAWAAYAPGLRGGFLFDDFVNLDALGNMGPIDNPDALLRYLTSGIADPTGRPLALLSFLLDARDWPADPAPFLRTNLCLHLGNGVLLFLLLRALGRRLDPADPGVDRAAVLGAGAWLLHPLLVSTTLYIVQREAMLAATFVLLGLLAWLHGDALAARAPRRGLAWRVGGIGLGTVLAVLCKANGILLPLLAWTLRATVLAGGGSRRWRGDELFLLVLPGIAVLAVLLVRTHGLADPIEGRAWTLGQRLLTEPRVILDYLQLLLVPRTLSTGLYNDAYVVSSDAWHPASTMPAMLAVFGLLAIGLGLRRRAPAFAAALLFFLAGHVLEGSSLPLELYFEHRNYLPAMLLSWPLARGLWRWQAPVWARACVSIALLAMLASITWQRASLWGRPAEMAALWALQNPASSRAQATAASYEVGAGRAPRARARLAGPWRRHPDDLQLALNYANAACASGGLSAGEAARIAHALRHATEGDQLLNRWLGRAMAVAARHACPGLDLAMIQAWVEAAEQNPRFATLPGRRQDLYSLEGRLALRRRDPARALAHFDRALAQQPAPQTAAMQAAWLASAGYHGEALRHLERFERTPPTPPPGGWNMQRLHAWVLSRQGFWEHELATLRARIRADAGPGSTATPGAGDK